MIGQIQPMGDDEQKNSFCAAPSAAGYLYQARLALHLALGYSSDSDLIQAIRRSTQDSGSRAGDQIVGKSLDIKPTITIRPGAIVRLVVHKDLILAPWKG